MFHTLAVTIGWPEAAIIIVVVFLAVVLYGGAKDRRFKLRKAEITAGREDELRQLVTRYEQLAETTLDAQAARSRRRLRTALAHHVHRTDPAHRRVRNPP